MGRRLDLLREAATPTSPQGRSCPHRAFLCLSPARPPRLTPEEAPHRFFCLYAALFGISCHSEKACSSLGFIISGRLAALSIRSMSPVCCGGFGLCAPRPTGTFVHGDAKMRTGELQRVDRGFWACSPHHCRQRWRNAPVSCSREHEFRRPLAEGGVDVTASSRTPATRLQLDLATPHRPARAPQVARVWCGTLSIPRATAPRASRRRVAGASPASSG